MIAAAGQLTRRVLVAQASLGIAVALVLSAVGPRLLLIPNDVAFAAIRFGLGLFAPLGTLAVLIVRRRLAQNRFVLRALALGSSAVEPEDVAELLHVPRHVATVSISLGLLIPLAFVSPLRPSIIDLNAAASFALLILVIVATAALPLVVLVRSAVARALELVHPDVMQALLALERPRRALRRRVIFRLLVAIAMPVAFVAVGATLIAHAHVRSFDAASRERTAEALAYALEPVPSASSRAGRVEAMREAHRLGFTAKVSDATLPFAIERSEDGKVSLTVPYDEGSATIRFADSHLRALTTTDTIVALAALGLASILGYAFGRSLTSDLVRATERLESLSTDEVLLGQARAAPPARWTGVSGLNLAIDTLTERFRVFAEAQERAISARESANRSRSLLFASVSHDLRNPLNAILGFTALVADTPLAAAQRESLEIIERRGRELLVLIETILELASVEAGQLELLPAPASMASIIGEAVRKGRELAAGQKVEIVAEVEPGLPEVHVDARRLVLAIAALLGHSARAGTSLADGFPIHLRATRSLPGNEVQLEIEHREGALSTEQVERLLRGEPDAASQRRYSGLTLGLSLARAIIELHGGSLRVVHGPSKTTCFRIGLRSSLGD